jgi:hypothetical protein
MRSPHWGNPSRCRATVQARLGRCWRVPVHGRAGRHHPHSLDQRGTQSSRHRLLPRPCTEQSGPPSVSVQIDPEDRSPIFVAPPAAAPPFSHSSAHRIRLLNCRLRQLVRPQPQTRSLSVASPFFLDLAGHFLLCALPCRCCRRNHQEPPRSRDLPVRRGGPSIRRLLPDFPAFSTVHGRTTMYGCGTRNSNCVARPPHHRCIDFGGLGLQYGVIPATAPGP